MLQSQSSAAEQSFPLSREEASSLRYVCSCGLRACLPEHTPSTRSPLHGDLALPPGAEGLPGSRRLCRGSRACERGLVRTFSGTNSPISEESCSRVLPECQPGHLQSVCPASSERTCFPQRLSRFI